MTETTLRPATADDMATCAELWRESINDYTGRLNQPEIPNELGRIIRLLEHLRTTDPELFLVAQREARTIGFIAAVRREALWFLSMCFVRPGEQGRGLGRRLLEAVLPADDTIRATATDSLQPLSGALYSRYGIVPSLPLFSLSGYVTRPDVLPDLPPGLVAVPFETLAGAPGGGHAELAGIVDAIDRELLAVAHPQDHRFLRTEGRHGFLYRDVVGSPRGYGYAWETGRVGPVAVRDPELLGPILGHLLRVVPSRGAQAVWVPATARPAVDLLLRAGLRFEDFPILLGWNRSFADFERYLPISPGLL